MEAGRFHYGGMWSVHDMVQKSLCEAPAGIILFRNRQ